MRKKKTTHETVEFCARTCLICCRRSKWGSGEPSLATKSVSHALALQPLPALAAPFCVQDAFFPPFFSLFFCHCAFTQHGCWCWRDYNRAFHSPFPPLTHPLLSPYCSCLGHSWRISAPPLPSPSYLSLLSPGLLAAKTHHAYQVLSIRGPEPPPHSLLLLMSHLFIFCAHLSPVTLSLCSCNFLPPPARLLSHLPLNNWTPELPSPPLCHWWELFPTCSFTVYKQKWNKKMSVFVYTRVWATISNTIKQKYIAFVIFALCVLFFFAKSSLFIQTTKITSPNTLYSKRCNLRRNVI